MPSDNLILGVFFPKGQEMHQLTHSPGHLTIRLVASLRSQDRKFKGDMKLKIEIDIELQHKICQGCLSPCVLLVSISWTGI